MASKIATGSFNEDESSDINITKMMKSNEKSRLKSGRKKFTKADKLARQDKLLGEILTEKRLILIQLIPRNQVYRKFFLIMMI